GGQFRENPGDAGLTTPSAPLRSLRGIFLVAQPPLLCEEGNISPCAFFAHFPVLSFNPHLTIRDADKGWAPNFRSKATVLSRTSLALSPPRGARPAASASGVNPPRSFAFRSAPFSTRNWTIAFAPVQAAPCKAVLRLSFAAWI